MTTSIELTNIRRRTFRDSIMDGLIEMMLGIWLFYISGALYKDGKGFSMALMPLVFFIVFMAIKYLKNRFVYPRIGYMEFSGSGKTWKNMKLIPYSLIAGLVILVAILFITGDYRYPQRWYFWIPVLIAIFLSGTFIRLALDSGLIRYYWYVLATILSAGLAMLLPVEGKLGTISNFLLILSGFLIIVGGSIFIWFIRMNPVQTIEVGNEKN